MKELLRKIMIILILAILAVNSPILLIISEATQTIEELIENKTKLKYEMNLEKYVNYSTKKDTGTLVQVNLKTRIEYEENQEEKPFQTMEILLNAPKIEEEYPKNVEIIAKTGKSQEKTFESNYNQETGEIKILSIKEQEEYQIIFSYGSNCYKANNEERNIEITGNIQSNFLDDNQTKKQEPIKEKYIVTENISGLLFANVTTSDIYNGYIDSNNLNNTTYQTKYHEDLEIDITQKEMADEIFVYTQHYFLNKSEEKTETNEIIYQTTKINKDKVLSILGEEGYLKILNENGETIGKLNKETEVGEEGNYEINYPNETSKITIQTSKPVKVGSILLQSEKYIKETMKNIEISKIEQNIKFQLIEKTKETKKIVNPETNEEKEEIEEIKEEIYQYENAHIVEIKDAQTKINLAIDKVEWANSIQNDVNFTAKIMANDIKYKLAKNPSLEIKLPDEVEKVILGNVSLLYSSGLNISNAQVIEKEEGKFIRIEITGNQSEYFMDNMITGVNILIPATIILKQDIESTKKNISCTFTNDNIAGNVTEELEVTIESTFVKPIEEEIEVINDTQIMTTTEPAEEPIVNETIDKNLGVKVQAANEVNENDLEINVQAKIGDQELNQADIVRERQIIKYSVTLTNKSNKTIEAIKVEGQVPEGTTYATVDMGNFIQESYEYIKDEEVKSCSVPISEIEPGKSKTIFYEVVVEDLAEGITQKEIANTITTKINEKIYHQETKNNVIKNAEIETRVKCYMGREGRNSFYYYFDITNLSDKVINNVQIETSPIQKELSLVDAAFYDKSLDKIGSINENNQYVAQIDKIDVGETRTILLIMSANNYDDYVNEVPLRMTVKVRGDNTATYISNEARRNGYPEYVTISQTLDKEGENVKVGDKVEYKYVIKNESKVRSVVQIFDKYSEFLEDVTVKYDMYKILNYPKGVQTSSDTFYDLEEEANLEFEREPREVIVSELVNHNVFDTTMVIPAGKTLEITVTGIAADVDKTTEVQNYMVVSGPDIKTRSSNISKFYIYVEEPKEPLDPDDQKPQEPQEPEIPDIPYDPFEPDYPDYPYNPDDPDISYNNKVRGIVWLDKNKDGIKQSDEETLKDISVKLYNASNNSMVDNGTYTNDNGEYEFTNISKGNYLVLFEYDTAKYTTTKFTQYGGNQNSSNAMKKTATIDGQEKTVAMTDILTINQSNIENLNLGLIENSTFDLKLDKYINQITVKNNKTKTYKYNNSQLAKIEIPAKQIENTQVEIEYKIVVTNEGNVDAYADEIIDYLPKDVQISNQAKDTAWTKDAKGNLLNRSLIGEKIQPGESKELKLVVTKKMSSQNTGNVLNAAEINMSKSVDNLKDVDSTAGNKKADEDDYSEASVIISINTGLVRNIIIFIVIVGFIAFIIIAMKNVKNKKMFAFILSITLFTCLSNTVQALEINGNSNVLFIGDDGNEYICVSPGMAQCIRGHHYYQLMKGYPVSQIIDYRKDMVNDTKIDKDLTNLGVFEEVNDNQEAECVIKVANGGYFDNCEVSIYYEYINNKGKKVSKTEDRIIQESEYEKDSTNRKIGVKFKIRVPKSATIVKVNYKLTINESYVTVEKRKITENYKCIGIAGEHGSINCHHGPDHVQNMSRSWEEEIKSPEPKVLTGKLSSKDMPEYGNIKVIKVDQNTGKLLRDENDNKGTAKFRICRENEMGKKVYLRSDDVDKDGHPLTTSNENAKSAIWEVDTYGEIDIESVPINEIVDGRNKKYTYYLEEIEPKLGYIKLTEKIEVVVSDNNITNKQKIKKGLNYFFTRNVVKDAIKEKSENKDGELNKSKYRRIVCNLIMGEELNSTTYENKSWYKETYNKIKISSSPTDGEIRNLIEDLVTRLEEDGREKDFFKEDIDKELGEDFLYHGAKAISKMRKNLEITNKLTQGNLAKTYASLAGYESIIVQNKQARAYLRVQKKDINTGEPLQGAVFRVTGTSEDGEEKYDFLIKTGEDGWTENSEVKFGTYEIEEVMPPTGYDLSLQDPKQLKKKITLKPKEGESTVEKQITFVNKKFVAVKISKVDRESDKSMKGVKFQIRRKDLGKYIKILDGTQKVPVVEGEITLNPYYGTELGKDKGNYHVEYVSNKEDATYFMTNANGEIEVKQLESHYGSTASKPGKPINYEIFETDTGETFGKYYAVSDKVHNLQIGELNAKEAYIYTVKTMLEELTTAENYKYVKQDIIQKKLSKKEREEHVINLVQNITGHKLYTENSSSSNRPTGGEGLDDILAGVGIEKEEQKKLLELIMKEYNTLYSDTSKTGIDVEIEFITDLVRNGIEKYSKQVNKELKKKYTDIIDSEIENFIPQKEDHEKPDGIGFEIDIDLVNLDNLTENIVTKIKKELDEEVNSYVDKQEKEAAINIGLRYQFILKKKDGKYTYSTDNTQNSYVKTMLTVRDVSKLEDSVKNKVAEGLFSLYSNKPLKPSQKAHYVQLLQGKKILRIENIQTWISLSGYVWEDSSNSKDNTKPPSDGYYNQLEENKVGGIPVILRDANSGGAIVKDKNGRDLITYTNENGEYRFDYITLIRDANEQEYNLKNYYVEFQYDGFTYTSVITGNQYLSGTNTSKARETDESRDELNNKFAKVEKDQSISVSTIQGNENKNVKLDYTKEGKKSTYINSHWNYTPTFNGQRIIMARRTDTVLDSVATTKETGYVIQRGEDETQTRYEIKNINLGLKQREMPNALIYNHDVDNIKVCINGHTNVYRYDQNMKSANKQPLQNGQVVANISSYTRWIAPSYIKSMEDLGSNHKIKIYVTYKITLQNASNTLTMKINTLDNYYDNRYLCNNIAVGDTIINNDSDPNYYGLRKEGNKKISNQIMIQADNNGNPYTSTYAGYNIGVIGTTNGQPITELKAQEEATMYVQYQIKDEAIKGILNQSQTLSNIVEISSYTTYYSERTEPDTGIRRTGVRRTGELYAAVDSNSAPRNADINKSGEYEDDTYSSPKVTLKVGDERAITGNVFEDLPLEKKQLEKDYVDTNKERKGNGIYEEDKESKIKGVSVQLIPVEQQQNGENTPIDNNTGISNIYPANKTTKQIAQTQTNEEGKYEFKGIVPGHYIVRFTYGNETIGQKELTAEKYKSTIRTGGTETGGTIDYRNPYWYQEPENKPRYSDAIDDETSRKEFNNQLSTINYGVKTNFEKASNKPTVYAQTNTMDVAIEDIEKSVIEYYDQYYNQANEKGPSGLIKNIDFGLIERPKQKMEVKKVVKHVKITLANGIVLIDGNPETMRNQYVTYIKDSELVKIEVDNEILQGSKLEITYELKVNNLSELDYSHMDYQWYGKKNEETQKTLVTQTISNMLDNMDTELSTQYKIQEIEGIYKLANSNMEQLKNTGKLSEQTYNAIKNSNNILLLNNTAGLKNIKPNESGSVEVLASKMLTTTSTKDNYFENYTEIVENKNPAGKFTEDSTPGNAEFSTIKGKEIDENGEALTIIPPTGGIKGWHIIVIGVVALTILVGGIILIKKKVLDE